MLKETFSSGVEVDCSVMNLFDKSTIYTAFYPVSAYVDVIESAGYRGMQWHPIRNTVAGAQMNAGLIGLSDKGAITSGHQSWRNEKSFREAYNHPNRAIAMASYILLSERMASLDDLEKLQRTVGRKLPVVLYPEYEDEESGTSRNFGDKTFQPTPEVMRRWDVRTVQQMIGEAKHRGYTGFCVDLAHLRGESVDGYTFNPWQETLPQLLLFAQEIHVSAGRFDMGYEKTQEELRDLIQGTGNTELSAMLECIGKSGWIGRVVTEIPAMALHGLRGNKPFMSVKNLAKDHGEIVYHIQTLLS